MPAWRALYAEALVGLGRCDQAEALLAPLACIAQGRRSSLLAAGRARGTLEAARGHPGRADAAFQAGLECASALTMPFERGMLRPPTAASCAGSDGAPMSALEAAQARFAHLDSASVPGPLPPGPGRLRPCARAAAGWAERP